MRDKNKQNTDKNIRRYHCGYSAIHTHTHTHTHAHIILLILCDWKVEYIIVSHSVVSDSLWPHGLQPIRLLCPWNSSGKNTRVDCHSLASQPRNQTQVFCITGRFFTIWAIGKSWWKQVNRGHIGHLFHWPSLLTLVLCLHKPCPRWAYQPLGPLSQRRHKHCP